MFCRWLVHYKDIHINVLRWDINAYFVSFKSMWMKRVLRTSRLRVWSEWPKDAKKLESHISALCLMVIIHLSQYLKVWNEVTFRSSNQTCIQWHNYRGPLAFHIDQVAPTLKIFAKDKLLAQIGDVFKPRRLGGIPPSSKLSVKH